MEKVIQVAVLSIGGVFGVNARYWLGLAISRWSGQQFPWATLLINVAGSFAIGVAAIVLSRWLPHPNVRLLVITGFLGGFTTYSAFAFESLALWERGDRLQGGLYMASTLAAGILAVTLGVSAGRALTDPRPDPPTRDIPPAAEDIEPEQPESEAEPGASS